MVLNRLIKRLSLHISVPSNKPGKILKPQNSTAYYLSNNSLLLTSQEPVKFDNYQGSFQARPIESGLNDKI